MRSNVLNSTLKVIALCALTVSFNVSVALACFCSIPGFHNGCPSSPLEQCVSCWEAHCGSIKEGQTGCPGGCTVLNCGYPDC